MIIRSNLPGLVNASSITSYRLVAANTRILGLVLIPSSKDKSLVRVWSVLLSGEEPVVDAGSCEVERRLPIESNSSINIMHGLDNDPAVMNKSVNLLTPDDSESLRKSDPETKIKGRTNEGG